MRLIWPAFLLCVALLLGALGVISVRVVESETARHEAEVQADVGQRVRLAMWRMDSEAAAMIVLENNRPTAQFRSFTGWDDEGKPIPSPLLTNPPEHAYLYFEVGADGLLRSPQVPAPMKGTTPDQYVAGDELARRSELQKRLRGLLELPEASLVAETTTNQQNTNGLNGTGNFNIAYAAANNGIATNSPPPAQMVPPEEQTIAIQQDQTQVQQAAIPQTKGGEQARAKEASANMNEFNRRADLVQRAISKSNTYSQQYRNQEANAAPSASDAAGPQGMNSSQVPGGASSGAGIITPDGRLQSVSPVADGSQITQVTPNRVRQSPAASPIQPGFQNAEQDQERRPQGDRETPADRSAGQPAAAASPKPQSPQPAAPQAGPQNGGSPQPFTPPAAPVSEDAQVTTFQPVWIAGELLLVRAVGEPDRQRIQGLWLKREALAESLLDGIRDLLPAATLRPYQPLEFTRDNVLNPSGTSTLSSTLWKATPKAIDNAPLALVSLPWELEPGVLPAVAASADPALRWLLGSAWGGAVLGILAAAALLRGVMALSERRASFVSSVTHELRTPLTTFRLYSEMLAEDMVPDGEKRRGYLRTLQAEAARLTHLVENVLAYSRIERGSARARIEDLSVRDLAARIVPRLEERAQNAGTRLEVELPDDIAALDLRTDVTAVDQILFNLVDNACKYAVGPAMAEPLRLRVFHDRGMLACEVCDHGPGVPPADRKRLFRPFHKSAQEAANTKPGVGLGLSLSRRLARALGGHLDLVAAADGPGACFRLMLPLAGRR